MKLFRKEEGFTLVELMVVVLIIGILVAIAIPVFNAASASARRSACQANLRTLDGATEQWVAANPANSKAGLDSVAAAALVLNVADPGDGTTGIYVKDWAGSSDCPVAANSYSAVDGDFSCSQADHNYE
jgi:type IV pilus assembly protein PilA